LTSSSTADGLEQESVWSAVRDRRGTLWVGTRAGLDYLTVDAKRDPKWTPQPLPGSKRVRSLVNGPDGALWVGADPGGLHRIDLNNRSVQSFGPKSAPQNRAVLSLSFDSTAHLWVATYGALFRSTPVVSQSKSVTFEQQFPPLSDSQEVFWTTLVDHLGRMWVGGTKGLALFDEQGIWHRFTTKDGLSDNVVAYLAEDEAGGLWIGYREAVGASRAVLVNGALRVSRYTAKIGLPSDKILFIGMAQRGRIWLGTDEGLDFFENGQWHHYTEGDGLISDDCNANAFFADNDESIWVGTSRGLSHFSPQPHAESTAGPAIVLTSAKLATRSLSAGRNVSVPASDNSLDVKFAALTFLHESEVRLRYRLVGHDNEWVDTTAREARYSKLSPGRYAFEVIARNDKGNWSGQPAGFEFRILPSWWQTWWFRMLGALAILLAAWQFSRLRIRHLVLAQQRLVTAVEARTRELAAEKARAEQLLVHAQQATRAKSEFLANMSHEIRTPLNRTRIRLCGGSGHSARLARRRWQHVDPGRGDDLPAAGRTEIPCRKDRTSYRQPPRHLFRGRQGVLGGDLGRHHALHTAFVAAAARHGGSRPASSCDCRRSPGAAMDERHGLRAGMARASSASCRTR
jgi:hypothetical protein